MTLKVNAFITIYNTRTKHIQPLTRDIIMETITDLIKPVRYISYDNKIKIISETIKQSRNTDYPTAILHRNFIINIISAYTDLEMNNDGFDILCENGLLELIISLF